jgi:hypothetical protein
LEHSAFLEQSCLDKPVTRLRTSTFWMALTPPTKVSPSVTGVGFTVTIPIGTAAGACCARCLRPSSQAGTERAISRATES